MKKSLMMAFVFAATLTGCVTVGKQFPPTAGQTIEVNKTTRDQIQKTYGDPDMQGLEDGDATWTYLYIKAGLFNPAQAEHLTIRFNKDGTVHSYTFNSNLTNPK